MGKLLNIIALASAAAVSAPAGAQIIPGRVTSQQIATICNENPPACLTYVVGALDGYFSAMVDNGRPITICLPAGISNGQLATIAVRFIRAHPERTTANAGEMVVLALRQAYPCRPPAAPRR
jgi:hypothetical protein